MNQTQQDAIREIERQLQIIWAAEAPPPPTVYTVSPTDDLQTVLDTVDAEIIDLNQLVISSGYLAVKRKLTLQNGTIEATPNVNDMLDIRADDVNIQQVMLRGDGTTKRGVVVNGKRFVMNQSEIRNIRRLGAECQAMATWNGADIFVSNTVLEGSTQSFMSGGSSPTIPNHVPSNIRFHNCLFTRPYEWLNAGYGCKTIFEVKSGRSIQVTNSILENIRTDGQTGVAITLTGSQYGNSPENIVEDIEFHSNIIRNASSGVSAIGWSQHQDDPTRAMLKGRNYRFINNVWDLSLRLHAGQNALALLGAEVDQVVFTGNDVTLDGGAAFLRITDKRLVTNLHIEENTLRNIGTYGVFSSLGSRGTNWNLQANPGIITGNTISGATSLFRTNFPDNVYV
jgi:hypothetical protein